MALNPNISLGVASVPIASPIDTADKIIRLQQLMGGLQVQKQQILDDQANRARVQAETESQNRTLQDQAAIKAAQSDPDFHAAYAKAGSTGDITPITDYFSPKGGIQENTASALTQNAQNIYKNAQLASEKDRANADLDAKSVAANISGLDPKDDVAAAQQLKGALQRTVSTAASKQTGDILTPEFISSINSGNVRDHVETLQNILGIRNNVNELITARQKAVAEAQEAQSKAQGAANTAQTGQQQLAATELGSVQDQAGLDSLRAKYPGVASQLPAQYSPEAVQQARTNLGVPIEKQPEYTQQMATLARMQNTKPQDWDSVVDSAVPKGVSKYQDNENSSVKSLVHNALTIPDPKAAMEAVQAAIKDGVDRSQQYSSAKELQQNTLSQEQTQKVLVPDGNGNYVATVLRPGQTAPAGTVTSSGLSTMSVPTSQTRSMAEMAKTVEPQIKNVVKEISDIRDKLGPAVGRWNDLWVKGAGMDDPQFAGLDQDLDLLSSAIVRTHFGARGGQQYREAVKKDFTEAQSPDDLISRIQHAAGWIEGYANSSIPAGQKLDLTKAAPIGQMETQTHNGDTYQRKAGSNDPWVRVKTQ